MGKEECLNLFNNYYVCPETNCLLPIVKQIVPKSEEKVAKSEEKVETVEKLEEEVVKSKEEEKPKSQEEEFTPIKDKESSESQEKKEASEEKEVEKEAEVEKVVEVKNEDEDVKDFLDDLKTPERKKSGAEIVVVQPVFDVYSVLIRVPKEYEMFLRE